MRIRFVLSPLAACLLLGTGLLGAPAAFAETFVVNATDDTTTFSEIGPCTSTHCNLRQAINAANASSVCNFLTFTCNQQVINFNLPRSIISLFNGAFFLGPPAPIKLNPDLIALTVTSRLLLDGTTQPGYAGTPTVIIQPAFSVSGASDGLDLKGFGSSVVRGVAFQSFGNSIGILIDSDNNIISQNLIGTNAGGSSALANSVGVLVLAGENNLIGGPGLGNVISGNRTGVMLNGGSGTRVQGNMIGTAADGTTAVPNTQDGVTIGTFVGSNNIIGGLGTGEGNVIAFNGGAGVGFAIEQFPVKRGNSIRANSIFSNSGLGIDESLLGTLGSPVVLQPAPALSGSTTGFTTVPLLTGGFKIVPTTSLSGTVSGKPNTTLSLDFFDNNACGEGQFYVGTRSVTTDASGAASFSVQFSTTFSLASATATSATNDTSVFSNCRFVSSPFTSGTPHLSPASAAADVHERFTYTFKWTVPPPATWHDLTSLQLRLRGPDGVALQLRWDAASNTFSVFNSASGKFGPAFAPGSPTVLETSAATVFLDDTSVKGAGPTAPTVTLTLSLGFKPGAASTTYVVEVAASDDLGHTDTFAPVGSLTVTR